MGGMKRDGRDGSDREQWEYWGGMRATGSMGALGMLGSVGERWGVMGIMGIMRNNGSDGNGRKRWKTMGRVGKRRGKTRVMGRDGKRWKTTGMLGRSRWEGWGAPEHLELAAGIPHGSIPKAQEFHGGMRGQEKPGNTRNSMREWIHPRNTLGIHSTGRQFPIPERFPASQILDHDVHPPCDPSSWNCRDGIHGITEKKLEKLRAGAAAFHGNGNVEGGREGKLFMKSHWEHSRAFGIVWEHLWDFGIRERQEFPGIVECFGWEGTESSWKFHPIP